MESSNIVIVSNTPEEENWANDIESMIENGIDVRLENDINLRMVIRDGMRLTSQRVLDSDEESSDDSEY